MIYNYILRGTAKLHRAATKLSQAALTRKVERANSLRDSIDRTHANLLAAADQLREAQRKAHSNMVASVAVEAAKCQMAQVSAVQQ